MNITQRIQSPLRGQDSPNAGAFAFDLLIYLSVMFLIREVYLPEIGFIANGLIWSTTTLIVASWRMKARGVTWASLGLRRPDSYKTALLATACIPLLAIFLIIVFQMLDQQIGFGLAPDQSNANASSKFGNLQGNWLLFFSIIPLIWLQSMLEELLDRGFLMIWLERMLSNTLFATIFAVLVQAIIFGFRHSYDLSERSITVGLIGLAMGVGYVVFGRNLWPLIIAHCALNTLSMLDRVG